MSDDRRPSPLARRRQPHTDEQSEAFLAKQAHQLEQIYNLELQAFETRRDGKTSNRSASKKHKGGVEVNYDEPEAQTRPSTWIKVIQELLQRKIDPQDYVRRIFSALDGTTLPAPQPDQLLSDKNLQRYRDAETADDAAVELALRLQRETARIYVTERMTGYNYSLTSALRNVLLDDDLELSYLFRYCLALSVEQPQVREIAGRFETGAVLQYIRNRPHYDRHWQKWLPEGFPQRAQQLYQQLIR